LGEVASNLGEVAHFLLLLEASACASCSNERAKPLAC